jgi:hypothetical protein
MVRMITARGSRRAVLQTYWIRASGEWFSCSTSFQPHYTFERCCSHPGADYWHMFAISLLWA